MKKRTLFFLCIGLVVLFAASAASAATSTTTTTATIVTVASSSNQSSTPAAPTTTPGGPKILLGPQKGPTIPAFDVQPVAASASDTASVIGAHGISGTVSVTSGTIITIDVGLTPYKVDASHASIVSRGASATIADIIIGDLVTVQGTALGTTIIASSVVDGVAAAGSVVISLGGAQASTGTSSTTPSDGTTSSTTQGGGFFGWIKHIFSWIANLF